MARIKNLFGLDSVVHFVTKEKHKFRDQLTDAVNYIQSEGKDIKKGLLVLQDLMGTLGGLLEESSKLQTHYNPKIVHHTMKATRAALELPKLIQQELSQVDWSQMAITILQVNQYLPAQIELLNQLRAGLEFLSSIPDQKISHRQLRHIRDAYIKMNEYFSEIPNVVLSVSIPMGDIIEFLSGSEEIFKIIRTTRGLNARERMHLRSLIRSVRKVGEYLSDLPKLESPEELPVANIVNFLSGSEEIFKIIRTTRGLNARERMHLRSLIRSVRKVGEYLSDVPKIPAPNRIPVKSLISFFEGLNDMFRAIKSVRTFRVQISVKQVMGAVEKSQPLIVKIVEFSRLDHIKEAHTNLKKIKGLIKSFASILTSLMLLAPLAAAFLLVSPALILLIWSATLVVKLLVKFIRQITGPRTILALVGLVVVIGLLALVTVGLLTLALLARPLVGMFVDILKLMLGLAGFAIALAAFGVLMTAISPLIVAATAGIALMVVATLSVLLIAGMLWLITQIHIDKEVVQESVQNILGTASSIIAFVFAPIGEPDASSYKPPKGLLSLLGNGIANLIGSLLGASILIMTAVSIGAILLICGMLKLIELINLDSDKIGANVGLVLDLCHKIISSIFQKDQENSEKSNRGFLGKMIGFVMPSLNPVIESILALAYLAVMIVAVLSVLMIAGLLRVLQNLDLDESKILDNVRAVMSSCRAITSAIFAPDEENQENSKRGILGTLISWVLPSLTPMLDAIFSMAYLAVMVISVSLVLGIAKLLAKIGSIDKSIFSQAKENVSILMETMAYIRECIFGRDEENSKASTRGVLMSVIAWVAGEGTAKMLEGILLIGNLAMMYFSVYLIAGLAKAMNTIAEINPDSIRTAGETAKLVVSTAVSLMDSLIHGEYEMPHSKDSNILERLLRTFAPKGLLDIADLMATVGKLSLIQVAIGAVSRIAQDLNDISNIPYNSKAAQIRARQILTDAGVVVDSLMKEFGDINKKTLKKFKVLMSHLSGTTDSISEIAQHLTALGEYNSTSLSQAVSRARDTIQGVKNILSSLIVDSREASWKELRADEGLKDLKKTLHKTIQPLLREVQQTTSLIQGLTKKMVEMGSLNGEAINTAYLVGAQSIQVARNLISLGMEIPSDTTVKSLIINGLETTKKINRLAIFLGEQEVPSADRIRTNSNLYQVALREFKTILDVANQTTVEADKVRSNLDLLERISQTIGSFVKVSNTDVENSRKITENYANFLTTVDKMDYQKLNTTAWMMKYWASISKDLRGDFEGLARSVSDHIMPMLDVLNKTMTEVTQCQEVIIEELSKPVELNVETGTSESIDTGTTNIYNTTAPTSSPAPPSNTPGSSFSRQPSLPDMKPSKKYLVQFAKIEEQ